MIAHAEIFFASQDIAALVRDPLASRVNVDFARELLDAGFNVSIDSFGHFYDAESLGRTFIADWQRLAGLIQLVDAGYSSQIVLGTDIYLKILTRRRGGEGYARLTGFAIPMLQRLGVAPVAHRRDDRRELRPGSCPADPLRARERGFIIARQGRSTCAHHGTAGS